MKRSIVVLIALIVGVVAADAQKSIPNVVSGHLSVGAGGGPAPDTTPPVVTITVPTSAATYDNGSVSSISIGGTATDNVSVASCTGLSDKTGAFSVNSTGGFWSTSSVSLQSGVTNNLSVTCVDPVGNSANDSIAVSYTAPSGSCVAGNGSCINNLSNTAPAVSDVVIASGEDLHQETKAGWSTFFTTTQPNAWNFEVASLAAMGVSVEGALTSISTVKPLMGSRHARTNTMTLDSGCNPQESGAGVAGSAINYNTPGPPQDVWLRFYQNFSYGSVGSPYWPSLYLKNSELFNGPANHYFQFRDGTPQGSTPTGFRFYTANNGGALPSGVNIVNSFPSSVGTSFDMDRWYLYEINAKSGSGAFVTWYIDGAQIMNQTFTGTFPSWALFKIGLVNGCAAAIDQSWDVINDIDGLAWGTQRIGASSKVEVCNESTYAACTTKIYQPPRYISDTSVSFTMRKASPAATLNAGACYVYITNNEGQVSAGSAMTCP